MHLPLILQHAIQRVLCLICCKEMISAMLLSICNAFTLPMISELSFMENAIRIGCWEIVEKDKPLETTFFICSMKAWVVRFHQTLRIPICCAMNSTSLHLSMILLPITQRQSAQIRDSSTTSCRRKFDQILHSVDSIVNLHLQQQLQNGLHGRTKEVSCVKVKLLLTNFQLQLVYRRSDCRTNLQEISS